MVKPEFENEMHEDVLNVDNYNMATVTVYDIATMTLILRNLYQILILFLRFFFFAGKWAAFQVYFKNSMYFMLVILAK